MKELESQTKKDYGSPEQKLKCFNCNSRIAEKVLKDYQELKNISQTTCPFCLSTYVRGKWIQTLRAGKIELQNDIKASAQLKSSSNPISFSSSRGVKP